MYSHSQNLEVVGTIFTSSNYPKCKLIVKKLEKAIKDALSFAEFEISEFEIVRFDCCSINDTL